MNNLVINQSIRFIVLVILQVFLFNHINLGGSVNPFFYVYFILLFPLSVSGWVFLLMAFLMGMIIDVMSSTYGLNTMATVFIAFLRNYFFKLISGEREFSKSNIRITDLSLLRFIVLASVLVFIHHFLYFAFESFRLSDIWLLVRSTIFSWFFSMILISVSFLMENKKD